MGSYSVYTTAGSPWTAPGSKPGAQSTTTCRAPGKLVLVVLLLSSVLMLFCWVHRAERQERLPPGHLLLSGLDIPFTVMGGLCSLAVLHA